MGQSEERPGGAAPTRVGSLVFETKAALLRVRRAAADLLGDAPRRHGWGNRLAGAQVLATVRSPLWTSVGGAQDRLLTRGKVHNLELARQGFDGVEVAAGEVLSFWRQVGRPSRKRGFVVGRELREGCMIATTGGGLCQLSNALYEAAINAGLETVERHAHTHIVPGSRATADRDATVFWNYVDLRVRAHHPVRIEVKLTPEALELVVRGEAATAPQGEPSVHSRAMAHDCLACGRTSCHRHSPDAR